MIEIPAAETYAFLSHPLTILLLATFAGMIGYLFKASRDTQNDVGILKQMAVDIKELLKTTIDDSKLMRSKMDDIRSDLDILQGQHDTLHSFEKKRTG